MSQMWYREAKFPSPENRPEHEGVVSQGSKHASNSDLLIEETRSENVVTMYKDSTRREIIKRSKSKGYLEIRKVE